MMNNIRNVTRISGYNQAARYFEETKKPRTVRWGEDERPLYNTASHHYRIVKGNNNGTPYYDLVLYSTSMIRYYKPAINGEQRVLVRGHSSAASRAFVWRHGMGMGRSINVRDGYGLIREGKLVLNPATHNSDTFGVPYNWSADLLFTDDRLYTVDVTRSRHIPIYKAASSDEDKAKRKQLKQTVDHWIELLGYRLDEYLNTELNTERWQKQRAGESFTSAIDLLNGHERGMLLNGIKLVLEREDSSWLELEGFVNAMTKLGHAVVTHLQGVRENQARSVWDYQARAYTPTKPIEPVTRAAFRKSMESHLVSLLGLREGSARIDVGQFPATIPRKWWC